MAKRKKLNLRLILVLSIVAAVLLVGGGYFGYRRGWHRKIIRINPVEAARKSQIAKEKGEYEVAEKQLTRAILYAPNPTAKADYLYQFAMLHLDWLSKKHEELNDSQRAQHFDKIIQSLRRALVEDNTHLDSQTLLVDLMWGYAQHGNWMAFIKEADALLQLTPNDRNTTFKRALAWSALARIVPGPNSENAIRDFRKAIELKGDEAVYHREYAQFLQQEGRVDEAVRAYEEALRQAPNDGDLYVQYAALLLSKDRPDEALKQVQQAIVRDPNNPIGNIALADRLLKERKTDAALETLEKAKQIDDSDYRIYNLLSFAYRQQQQTDKAMSALRDGLAAIDKRLTETSTTSPATDRIVRALEGNRYHLLALLCNGLLDEASAATDEAKKTESLNQAKELLDKMTWIGGIPGQREKTAGRIAYLEGDFTKAQALLEQAYESLGPDLQLADTLIRIYLLKNLPGKAEQILDTLRRNPQLTNDNQVLFAKAQLEMQYRDFDEAQRYLDQILRADPNHASARNLRQLLAVMRGETPIDTLLAEKDIPPRVVVALLERAQTLWLNNERDQAIGLLETLHAKVPNNDTVRQALLTFYVDMENLPKAKGILAEIKAAHPERTAVMELQEKIIEEKDPKIRYQLALQMADLNPDPVRRALEKAARAAQYDDPEGQGTYLKEAYQLKGDDLFIVEQLLVYAITRQDWKLGEECVQAATKFNLDQSGGKVFAARLAMGKGEYSKAIETLVQVVNEKPNVKFPWIMLGDCYTQIGDLEKAEKAYFTVAKTDPAYVPALVSMAMVTERLDKTAEHAEWVDRAYRLAPTNSYIQRRRLNLLESKLDAKQVIEQREQLLRQNPSDMNNRVRLAVLYEKDKQMAKAEELYVSAYTESQNKLGAARLLAGFYIRSNRGAEAEKLLVDLIQTWPDKVAAYLTYALYLANVNLDQAKAAVQKAIEIDPKDTRSYRTLAVMLLQRSDWVGAADALSKYLEVQPDDAVAARELVRARLFADQLPQAEQQLNALLATQPSNANLLSLKGDLALRQGDLTQAMETFDRALQIDGGQLEALLGQASVFLAQGKNTEAKMALTKARGISRNPEITMVLAGLHARLGDMDMAAMVLRELLSDPETESYAPAMRELLRIYQGQERWQKVAELLAEAKSKFPTDPYYLMVEAQMYERLGRRDRAITAMESAAKLAPESQEVLREYLLTLAEAGEFKKILTVTDPLLNKPSFELANTAIRARALAKLNRTDEADSLFLAAFKDASPNDLFLATSQLTEAYGANVAVAKMTEWTRLRPQDPLFHFLLGALYKEAQNYPQAIEVLTKASSLTTTPLQKSAVERELGLAYYQMRKFPEAEKAYLASLQASDKDIATLNNLAYMYTNDMNQPEKALPHAAKAAQLAPGNANVLDTYGWTLAKTGDYAQAERQLARALQLNTTPMFIAQAQYHLGWVCEQINRLEEAARHYSQGSENLRDPNDPLHKELSEALKRVQKK